LGGRGIHGEQFRKINVDNITYNVNYLDIKN
jgi:hypothetical protein